MCTQVAAIINQGNLYVHNLNGFLYVDWTKLKQYLYQSILKNTLFTVTTLSTYDTLNEGVRCL